MPYFNYRVHAIPAAEGSTWQRREFVNAWWRIYAGDPRWIPPVYSDLTRELQLRHNSHLSRLRPIFIHVDALHRSGMGTPQPSQPMPMVSVFERPLAATVLLHDPRRSDRTGYLALLHAANDADALEHLLDAASELGRHSGLRRVILSTGLSPHVGSGIQIDAWNLDSPTGAPSNPPYLPDLLHDLARPIQSAPVYAAAVSAETETTSDVAALRPLDPQRLAADLLPMLAAVGDDPATGFAPPDHDEIAFLLRQLQTASLSGWLAERNGRPVGFVLLGADQTPLLRRHGGGKRLHRRALLALNNRIGSTAAGRVYFGGVLPEERRHGIGRWLWQAAMETAVTQGWHTLTVGPVWSPTAQAFLAAQGAGIIQSADLFEINI